MICQHIAVEDLLQLFALFAVSNIPLEVDIHTACRDGSVNDVTRCIDTGVDVNSHNDNGLTPLHLATLRTQSHSKDIIDLLLNNKAKVNSQSLLEGDTALLLAVRYNDTRTLDDIIARLLIAGTDVDIRNYDLRRAYDYATSRSDIPLSEVLYECEDLKDREGAVKHFMEQRASNHGLKLIEAVIASDEKQIDYCLERKTDYNVVNKHGAGSIHYTITHYKGDKVQLLEKLIKHGAAVNLYTSEGDTALNLSIKRSELRSKNVMYKLVELLLNNNTDTTVRDLDDNDARTLATKRKYKDIVKLLDNKGKKEETPPPSPVPAPKTWPKPVKAPTPPPTPPPPTSKPEQVDSGTTMDDTDYQSDFLTAVEFGTLADVQKLIEKPSIDANTRNENGDCPLHLALHRTDSERNEIIELLMNNRINKDAQDKDGDRPLHIAARMKDLDLVNVLLDCGVDSVYTNKNDKMPHEVADELKYKEIADVLRLHANREKVRKKARTCVVS